MTEAEFMEGALSNSINRELLLRLRSIGLPGCHLTAGCLFQPIWNGKSGRAAQWGVKDYDIFYFDEDLSWSAEDAAIRRVSAETADLSVTIEVKNQARVHLWYRDRFGEDYPPLRSSRDGIDRYLVACTCVGIEAASHRLYAPNGLDELARGVLRMNPANPSPGLFMQKARSYQSRWPWLTIMAPPLDDPPPGNPPARRRAGGRPISPRSATPDQQISPGSRSGGGRAPPRRTWAG